MTDPLRSFLAAWEEDPRGVKPAFERLAAAFDAVAGCCPTLVSRPGVTHSLRAMWESPGSRPLFAMVDVVEDPDGRWLSICFFSDTVRDKAELGNQVPDGLFGENANCFDIEEPDPALLDYVLERVAEAASAHPRS